MLHALQTVFLCGNLPQLELANMIAIDVGTGDMHRKSTCNLIFKIKT